MSAQGTPKYTRRLRTLVFVAGDMLIWGLALWGAFMIRFDGVIPPSHMERFPFLLALFFPIKLVAHTAFRLYRMSWRLVGLTDIVNVWKANSIASLSAVALILLLRSQLLYARTPRSVLILDYLLSLAGIGLFRVARRLWGSWHDRGRHAGRPLRRILLIGAGAAGERLARAMFDEHQGSYLPVGFIDDDLGKRRAYIHGLQVFGGREVIPDTIRRHRVDEVVIAIPSATSHQLRGIVEALRRAEMRQIRILPGVTEMLSSKVRPQDIRDVSIDDLLGRPPLQIDMEAIGTYLSGKCVLVSGAAGSIGAEIVRQLTRFECSQIVAVDTNETGLFELEEALRALQAQVPLYTAVADIRDREKVNWLLRTLRPSIVFHAAAYKHVPLMERHVEEAVKTNIMGSFTLAEAAVRVRVEKFVLISTDKAANPKSVLGLTKRVAERVIQALGQQSDTQFLAVRFGNVLGSRGSLIPMLQEQIRRGGPITLTHPDMQRYFMSSAEAVLLVLQTALMDRQTGVFVLDMGKPVRITDLAQELLRLSGLEPDKDVPIVFTGIRPGEKMEEDLTEPDEVLLPTRFSKILEIKPNGLPSELSIRLALQEMERLAREMDADGLRRLLVHLAQNGDRRSVAAAAATD